MRALVMEDARALRVAWVAAVGVTAMFVIGVVTGVLGPAPAGSQTPPTSEVTPVSVRWYTDRDQDGAGDWYHFLDSAGKPEGYVDNFKDCNDMRPTVYEGHVETPGDGLDNNCNASFDGNWEHVGPKSGKGSDVDGDGVKNPYYGGTDCDDYDSRIWPGNVEKVNDGIDNDCNLRTMDGGYAYPRDPQYLEPHR